MIDWLLTGWSPGHMVYLFLVGYEIGLVVDWAESRWLPADII